MTNKELLKLILNKIEKKFNVSVEDSKIAYENFKKNVKGADDQFEQEIGKMKAYNSCSTIIYDLLAQESLGIMDYQGGSK